jgi:hypothetical protein
MIIDQLNVFFDDVAAAATLNSSGISVSPLLGRAETDYAHITVIAKGPNAAAIATTVKVQESDDNATFTDVATFTLGKPDANDAVLVMRIPLNLKKKYVRLGTTSTGTLTGVTLFAAITRDDFEPYTAGQYINAGKVVA